MQVTWSGGRSSPLRLVAVLGVMGVSLWARAEAPSLQLRVFVDRPTLPARGESGCIRVEWYNYSDQAAAVATIRPYGLGNPVLVDRSGGVHQFVLNADRVGPVPSISLQPGYVAGLCDYREMDRFRTLHERALSDSRAWLKDGHFALVYTYVTDTTPPARALTGVLPIEIRGQGPRTTSSCDPTGGPPGTRSQSSTGLALVVAAPEPLPLRFDHSCVEVRLLNNSLCAGSGRGKGGGRLLVDATLDPGATISMNLRTPDGREFELRRAGRAASRRQFVELPAGVYIGRCVPLDMSVFGGIKPGPHMLRVRYAAKDRRPPLQPRSENAWAGQLEVSVPVTIIKTPPEPTSR